MIIFFVGIQSDEYKQRVQRYTSPSVVYDLSDGQGLLDNLAIVSLKLHEFLLFDNNKNSINLIGTPVLVLLSDCVDIDQINLNLALDSESIIVDTLDTKTPLSYIYGTVVSMMKLLKSATKLKTFFKEVDNDVIKFPYSGHQHSHFRLIWYGQRIGLKIYEKYK